MGTAQPPAKPGVASGLARQRLSVWSKDWSLVTNRTAVVENANTQAKEAV